ncbi:MAG: fasciclin domain-containing protein [Paracoccaceae bacterium]
MTTLMKSLFGATMLTGVALSANAQSADMTIGENAMAVADFSTLVAAAQAADLVDVLTGEGPYTIFAPNNAAFDALPEGTVESLLMPENLEQLQTILSSHIVSGVYDSNFLSTTFVNGENVAQSVTARVETIRDEPTIVFDTLSPNEILVEQNGGEFYVSAGTEGTEENAQIIQADIMSSNGVIHVIDKVLTPNM